MPALSQNDDSRSGGSWLQRLGGLLPGASHATPPAEPTVTRAEIARWLAEAVSGDLTSAMQVAGRPSVAVVRCQFAGFQDDLRQGLEVVLNSGMPCDVLSTWPTDPDEARAAARATIDALNAGRSRIFILPHERALAGFVPSIDAVLALRRFTPTSLAEACRRFYELDAAPPVPDEPWVPLVCPSDLLISSEVSGNPTSAIKDAARSRLRNHDCSEAVRLESLLGLNEVRTWAESLIEDIRDALDPRERCRWADIERAVVFAGPRGVGKTSLSRAVARETGMRWIKASARRWANALDSERWQASGDRPASLQAIESDFDAARQLAPSVMYVEDLGALTPQLAAVVGRVVADGDDLDPVLVIGSATDEDLPDSEILKAGGFEHTVFLPLPSSNLLTTALQQRLSSVPHELTEAQVKQVGRLTLGDTAADLDRHVRKARQVARRSGAQALRFDDLAAAILETPVASARPKVSESELVNTAYHEAGHAVVHYLESAGDELIQYITVVPRRLGGGTALGFVLRTPDEERFSMSRAEGLALIRSLLGGRAAEELLLGREHVTTGAGGSLSSDLAKATGLAKHLIGRCGLGDGGSLIYRPSLVEDAQLDRQTDALLRSQYRKTRELLRMHWHLVAALADRLVAEQELSGDEVRATLSSASRGLRAEASPQPTPAKDVASWSDARAKRGRRVATQPA